MKTKLKIGLGLGLAACAVGLNLIPSDPAEATDHQLTESKQEENISEGFEPYEVKTDPGWHEQWFNMRKNDQGIIPFGLYSQWHAHDAQLAGQRSTIVNNVQETGPFSVGGRTRALLIDYGNTSRYFAGGVSGGLWRSNNAGSTWTPLGDDYPNMGVTCITQNPFNHSEIYYGTGESSANSAGFPGEGIFKSTDGGSTFSQLPSTLNSNFDGIWSIKHSLTTDDLVFAGTNNDGFWRSTDGGASWTEVYVTSSRVNDVETFPNGDVMIGLNTQGIFRSSDNGNTWTEMTSGLPASGFQRIEIEYSRNNPGTVYAIYAGGSDVLLGVYKSTDGGTTWTAQSIPTSTFKFTWYCFVMGVDPDNADRLFIGAQYAYYSTNGGTSWSSMSTGHADNHSYAVHTSNPTQFLIGNDGGVYRKSWTSLSSSPTDLNSGYHVTQFYGGNYFPTGNNATGGTQDNGTHRVLSSAWKSVMGGDGGYTAISLQNADRGYAEYQNGQIRRSSNMTATTPSWTSVYSSITGSDHFISPFEINRADGEQVYFATTSQVWRTTNAGTSWTPICNAHSTIYAIGVTRAVNPTVYFGGSSANFYRVDNATSASAGSEVDLSSSVPSAVTSHVISCIRPHPSDNSIVYVTFSSVSSQPRIYRVNNANTASPVWTAIYGDMPSSLPCNSIEVDPDNDANLIVGTDYGVYTTDNGGTNWTKIDDIPNASVHQVQLRHSDRQLFVFTHGRGLWSASLNSGSGTADYASLPYSTGFESGTFDQYWSTSTSNASLSRIQITSAQTPHSGSNHLLMDVNTNNVAYVTNSSDLHLDLAGHSGVNLNFWWKEILDETHAEDGVFLSDDGGASFVKVLNMSDVTSNTWIEENLDIDALASANGLSLSSTFVVRFQQHDNYGVTSDGIAVDDINVTSSGSTPGYASLPYSTGFEAGSADSYWELVTSNSNGRIQVTSGNSPQTGSFHLTMDVITNGTYAQNEGWLKLNLAGESNVELAFAWKEHSEETDVEDGVFISDDGGASFVKVYDLANGSAGVWNNVVLDLSSLISSNGLSHSGTFVIKFQQYDNFALTTDGIAIDNINVSSSGEPIVESGPLGDPVEDETAIEEALFSSSIYPVPADNQLTVAIDGAENGAVMQVHALNGALIREIRVSNGIQIVELTGMSSGTYLVTVINGTERHQHKLLKR